jgi:cytoskeletal protein CcmA (bactofilin family)
MEVYIMFSSSKNTSSQAYKVQTVIGSGTTIEGDIKSSGAIRIDGGCVGDIITDADVIIGENASIKGDIIAFNVTLAGKVEGNVRCSGALEITVKGNLTGDVLVSGLSIEKGAVFSGKCSIVAKEVESMVAADIED